MKTLRSLTVLTGLFLSIAITGVAAAQESAGGSSDSLFYRLASSQRAKVTRAELQRSLSDIESVLASSGYSADLRAGKEAEAEIIRRRLIHGDIRPGDVIQVGAIRIPAVSMTYSVTADTTIFVPTVGEVKLSGLLRSEVEDHLRKEIGRAWRDPVVRAEANIRLGIFGGVGRQSFFVAPASAILPDVIMEYGGGPSSNYKPEKSEIRRKDQVIIDSESFVAAVREGRSLDELGLQSGDEIHIGAKRTGRLPILAAISTAASLTYLILRIF